MVSFLYDLKAADFVMDKNMLVVGLSTCAVGARAVGKKAKSVYRYPQQNARWHSELHRASRARRVKALLSNETACAPKG